MPRTDIHRPGAIIPSEYDFVFSYYLPTTVDGWPIPGEGVNCLLPFFMEDPTRHAARVAKGHDPNGFCCILGLRAAGKKFVETGGTGKCSVCGANYIYGDVWVHRPTGDHIHIGHDCADKYNMLADRTDWELKLRRTRERAALEAARKEKADRRAAYVAGIPGLADALALKDRHRILADLDRKLTEYGSLSDKQIAFAKKLALEVLNPPPAEVHVPAPTGKVVVRGTVVSVKPYESVYGLSLKMTVKVATPGGSWLTWGTVPRELGDVARGAEIEFTATLKPGRDPHFALFSRPRLASVVTPAPITEAA